MNGSSDNSDMSDCSDSSDMSDSTEQCGDKSSSKDYAKMDMSL